MKNMTQTFIWTNGASDSRIKCYVVFGKIDLEWELYNKNIAFFVPLRIHIHISINHTRKSRDVSQG